MSEYRRMLDVGGDRDDMIFDKTGWAWKLARALDVIRQIASEGNAEKAQVFDLDMVILLLAIYSIRMGDQSKGGMRYNTSDTPISSGPDDIERNLNIHYTKFKRLIELLTIGGGPRAGFNLVEVKKVGVSQWAPEMMVPVAGRGKQICDILEATCRDLNLRENWPFEETYVLQDPSEIRAKQKRGASWEEVVD
jgi:hypothetical protein